MLTSYADDEALFGAIMAGAEGYVLKQIRGNDLVAGVRSLASGHSLLDPEAVQRVMHQLSGQTATADPLAGLTRQERRILALIGEGLTNRQIGDRLFLAEKTVKNYVSVPLHQARHAPPRPGGRLRRPCIRPAVPHPAPRSGPRCGRLTGRLGRFTRRLAASPAA